MKFSDTDRRQRAAGKIGSILIYVLWLSALLGLFTLSIGYTVRQKLKMIERIDSRRSLRLAAESAVQRGLWAIKRPTPPEKRADALSSAWSNADEIFKDIILGQTRVSVIKNQDSKSGSEVTYGLIDEESKVNVNRLKDSEILERLILTTTGATDEEASTIADSILDWIDEDDHVNASGAEKQYYRGLKRPLVPKNASLDALEELLYVRGMTPEIYKKLSRVLTLFGDGKINLNTATAPVLRALGFEQAAVDFILSYRAGVDRKIATKDDGVFYNPSELSIAAASSGNLSGDSISSLESLVERGLFKVTSDFYEVQVIASRKAGQELLTARAVISRQNGIQSWSEFNTQKA